MIDGLCKVGHNLTQRNVFHLLYRKEHRLDKSLTLKHHAHPSGLVVRTHARHQEGPEGM